MAAHIQGSTGVLLTEAFVASTWYSTVVEKLVLLCRDDLFCCMVALHAVCLLRLFFVQRFSIVCIRLVSLGLDGVIA